MNAQDERANLRRRLRSAEARAGLAARALERAEAGDGHLVRARAENARAMGRVSIAAQALGAHELAHPHREGTVTRPADRASDAPGQAAHNPDYVRQDGR